MLRRLLIMAAVLIMAVFAIKPASAVQFGVVTKFEQNLMTPDMIGLIDKAGVSIHRDAIAWTAIEPSRGNLVWPAKYDRLFATLRQRNIRSVLVLQRGNPLYDGGRFPTSPRAVAAYARFAASVARKLRGQVVAFEIGNEWRPSPGIDGPTTFIDYVNLFVAAANAIHAVDPSAQVVADPAIFANLPPTAPVPASDTPVGANARRALAVADGVVSHQYPFQNVRLSTTAAQDLMVRMMTRRAVWLEALAGRRMPLYVTEYGWPLGTARRVTPEDQARLMAETTARIAAMPFVKIAIAYELIDSCGGNVNIECTFGLYERLPGRGIIAKPALARFRESVVGGR